MQNGTCTGIHSGFCVVKWTCQKSCASCDESMIGRCDLFWIVRVKAGLSAGDVTGHRPASALEQSAQRHRSCASAEQDGMPEPPEHSTSFTARPCTHSSGLQLAFTGTVRLMPCRQLQMLKSATQQTTTAARQPIRLSHPVLCDWASLDAADPACS